MNLIRNILARFFYAMAQVLFLLSTFFRSTALAVASDEFLVKLGKSFWTKLKPFKHDEYTLSGWMPWEERTFSKILPEKGNICVIGSGTGREIIAMNSENRDFWAIEYVSELSEIAKDYFKKFKIKAQTICADAVDFEFEKQEFDSILIAYFTYSYIPGRDRRIKLLRNAGRSLKDGASLILTFRPIAKTDRKNKFVRGLKDSVPFFKNEDRFGFAFESFQNEVNYSHQFSKEMLEKECVEAGFHFSLIEHSSDAGVALLRKNK